MKRYNHIKTGNTYYVFDNPVINCTNGREDEILVIYTKNGKLFAREIGEFNEKFELIKNQE